MNSIPKVIHYCWFGKGEKSKLVLKCIESWKKYCPDYEIIEWNEYNYDISKNKYISEAYKNKKWAFVSDYARLDILFNYGGIYLDTDVELIKSIPEELLNYDGFFCLEHNDINTGSGFATKKNSDVILNLLNVYSNLNFVNEDGSLNCRTCVDLCRDTFISYFGQYASISDKSLIKNYLILPSCYFSPLDYITGNILITDSTVGIHWYGASWMSPKKRFIKKIKRFIKKILGKKIVNIIKSR